MKELETLLKKSSYYSDEKKAYDLSNTISKVFKIDLPIEPSKISSFGDMLIARTFNNASAMQNLNITSEEMQEVLELSKLGLVKPRMPNGEVTLS
jgi:hypothetical protein